MQDTGISSHKPIDAALKAFLALWVRSKQLSARPTLSCSRCRDRESEEGILVPWDLELKPLSCREIDAIMAMATGWHRGDSPHPAHLDAM